MQLTALGKGRVERANLTLQDRLVKELRLRKIDTKEAANAYAPHFIADFNGRFGKEPRSAYNAHRPLRDDEDLDLILTCRASRCVSNTLTVQYDRVIYLLDDTLVNRGLIHHYLDVYEYPDGRIEIRVGGRALPYSTYDKLGEVDQGAIVESKRLSQVLRVAQQVQAQRDSRAVDVPSSAHRADGKRIPRSRVVGSKSQRELGAGDLQQAIQAVEPELLPPLAGRQTARRGRTCNWDRKSPKADISI